MVSSVVCMRVVCCACAHSHPVSYLTSLMQFGYMLIMCARCCNIKTRKWFVLLTTLSRKIEVSGMKRKKNALSKIESRANNVSKIGFYSRLFTSLERMLLWKERETKERGSGNEKKGCGLLEPNHMLCKQPFLMLGFSFQIVFISIWNLFFFSVIRMLRGKKRHDYQANGKLKR